jgi:hypothetical protein
MSHAHAGEIESEVALPAQTIDGLAYFPDAIAGVIGAVEIDNRILTPEEVEDGLALGRKGVFAHFVTS